MLLFGIAADVTDEVHEITGRSQEGLVLAAVSFCKKCSLGLGSFLAGIILQLSQTDQNIVSSNGNFREANNLAMWLVMCIILLTILFLLSAKKYNLPQSEVKAIQTRLNYGV